MLFNVFFLPEALGDKVVREIEVFGEVVDIHNQPVSIKGALIPNVSETLYKGVEILPADPVEFVSSPDDGSWSVMTFDSEQASPDMYYNILLNRRTLQKSLPAYPFFRSLNSLPDYE